MRGCCLRLSRNRDTEDPGYVSEMKLTGHSGKLDLEGREEIGDDSVVSGSFTRMNEVTGRVRPRVERGREPEDSAVLWSRCL